MCFSFSYLLAPAERRIHGVLHSTWLLVNTPLLEKRPKRLALLTTFRMVAASGQLWGSMSF